MATYGIFFIIFRIILPLILGVIILANLPAIIGGILGMALALFMMPFYLGYLAFRDRHIFRENRKKRQNNNRQDYQQEYKAKDEPRAQADTYYESYDLLGVNFNATRSEIRAAFKNKMMMNHPDKLSTLDPELQRFAMERTIAIKDAYERLTS